MRILVASPQGFATDALRSMLTALDSNCEVDVIDDFPSRLLSPPIPPSPAPDLVVVDVDGASVDVNAIVRECLLRWVHASMLTLKRLSRPGTTVPQVDELLSKAWRTRQRVEHLWALSRGVRQGALRFGLQRDGSNYNVFEARRFLFRCVKCPTRTERISSRSAPCGRHKQASGRCR